MQRVVPRLAGPSTRLHDHITPLACEIQHRHQHGAFGMKTALQPPLPPREILLWEKGRTHRPLAARAIDIAVNVAAKIAKDKAQLSKPSRQQTADNPTRTPRPARRSSGSGAGG